MYLLRVMTNGEIGGLHVGEEIPFKFDSIHAISTFIDMCEKHKVNIMEYQIRRSDEDE